MIVLDRKPISISESKDLAGNIEENIVLTDYFKKFAKLSKSDALKLSKEVRELNNPKIKESHIVKIIDFLPQTSEEVNKIFNEVSLLEAEANAVIGIVKNY